IQLRRPSFTDVEKDIISSLAMSTFMVKIEIDREGCIQCGVCYNDECPEIFGESDDGTSEIVEQYRVGGDLAKGEAPDSMSDCANRAADACPVTVITVIT
ncbi:MAG TPA: ferredoxin, partial [Methanomassiliicoccaceae archaeon]|nr:ferredoxin [Methanomassiliicoccaceae archaeon]